MNLEKIAAKVARVLGDAADIATDIVGRLPTFITLADEAADLVGDTAQKLKGADKLKLVKAMAEAALDEIGPELAGKFSAIWSLLSPVITTLVQLRKLGLVKF